MEIITLVEQSPLSVKATLKELGINRSTFYQWYKRYLQCGYEGLSSQGRLKRGYWNQVPEKERNQVVEIALQRPELSCRELAWHIVDQEGWFTSRRKVSIGSRIDGVSYFEKPGINNDTGLPVNGSSGPVCKSYNGR